MDLDGRLDDGEAEADALTRVLEAEMGGDEEGAHDVSANEAGGDTSGAGGMHEGDEEGAHDINANEAGGGASGAAGTHEDEEGVDDVGVFEDEGAAGGGGGGSLYYYKTGAYGEPSWWRRPEYG